MAGALVFIGGMRVVLGPPLNTPATLGIWTSEHVGLLLALVGTALLAFSLKARGLYDDDPHTKAVLERNPGRHMVRDRFNPTETRIDRRLFWFGLLLIAVGTAMQW